MSLSQFSGNGMYLGRFQTLAQRKRRKNARQSFGHHRLSASGCANHYQVVPSCGSYFECAFHAFLSFYVCKVVWEILLILIKFFARIDYGGFQLSFNVEEFYDFFYICYSIDIQVVNHSRFAGILPGKDESFKALFACTDGDG